MSNQYRLVQKVLEYNPDSDKKLLNKAIELCKEAHKTQKRASGEPYYTHPLAVAEILAELKLDDDTIITGLLHDTVEDTSITIDDIKKDYGEKVADLVEGVTKLNKIEYQPENVRQAENFRKLLVAMSEDIRILLVKIADRLHNMRTISHINSMVKRKKISQETIEIFAPLAERIGMHRLKDELQDLAFKEIQPEVRESIIQRLEFLKKQGDTNIVNQIVGDLVTLFNSKSIDIKVYGREKKPYSIWQKMQKKNVSFEQLSDIMAFRIIAKDVEECYVVLGMLHSEYHSVPGSFKDFISTPKNNGYRSIHTTIIGPGKNKIEIQIRTELMHQIAEFGIAAHWCYKQGIDEKKTSRNYKWLQELLHILDSSSDPEEFIRNTRLEMHQDQVFCFSPKGDLIALPQGATAVDFAYAIHSDVGNTCMGIKINGLIAPLRTVLKNGDQIEVLCSENQHPSEGWEEFVVTGKAKAQVRRYIRSKKRGSFLDAGKVAVFKLFKDRKTDYSEKDLKSILHVFSKDSVDDLLVAVGENLISASDVFKALHPDFKEKKNRGTRRLFKFFSKKDKKKKKERIVLGEYPIKGLIPGTPVSFAGCCHPLPGDKIFGVIHTGKGITIHVAKCKNVNRKEEKNSVIRLYWTNTENQKLYSGRVRIVAANNFGVISHITSEIASQNVNISNVKIIHRTDSYYEFMVDLEVENVKQLENLKAYLRASKLIYSVERL